MTKIKCEVCNGLGFAELANMTIGEKLKFFRKKSGLTQREVQKATGIKNENICQMESGAIKSPTFNTIMKLVECYDIEAIVLLDKSQL